jgi:quercetin dioxygenase-like cupin family protein
MAVARLTKWTASDPPDEAELRRRMSTEGLSPYSWSNAPFDTYAAHGHDYNKVIYVVSGSITFGLPESGRTIQLAGGDRLDLPAGTLHDASVGAEGVVCLEAHN